MKFRRIFQLLALCIFAIWRTALAIPHESFVPRTEAREPKNYFRDFDPTVGRYVQSDPIGLRGGINTFGYVNGRPSTHYDPDGTQVLCLTPPFCVPFLPPGIPTPNPTPGLPTDPELPPPSKSPPVFPKPNPVTLCAIAPAMCAALGK